MRGALNFNNRRRQDDINEFSTEIFRKFDKFFKEYDYYRENSKDVTKLEEDRVKLEYYKRVKALVQECDILFNSAKYLSRSYGDKSIPEFRAIFTELSGITEGVFEEILNDMKMKLAQEKTSAFEYNQSYEELAKLMQIIGFLKNEYEKYNELVTKVRVQLYELNERNSAIKDEFHDIAADTRQAVEEVIAIYCSSGKLKYHGEVRKCINEITAVKTPELPEIRLSIEHAESKLLKIADISRRIEKTRKQTIARYRQIIKKAVDFLIASNLLDENEKTEIAKKMSYEQFKDLIKYLKSISKKTDKTDGARFSLDSSRLYSSRFFELGDYEDIIEEKEDDSSCDFTMTRSDKTPQMKGVKRHYKRGRLKKLSIKESREEMKEMENRKLDAKYGTEMVENNFNDRDIWLHIHSVQIPIEKKPEPPIITANDKRLWELYRHDNPDDGLRW